MTSYNIQHTDDGVSVVTWVGSDNLPRTLTDTNVHYTDVVADLIKGYDPDWYDDVDFDEDLDDDRIEYDADGVTFDGERIPETVTEVIARYQIEGRDTSNLVKFMERLAKNPSFRSREMLFTWTQGKDMVIDSEGFVIGYKGVTSDMLSLHSGRATVDGVEHEGQIPNLVGTVIEMPRSQVQDDPNKGCSHGLHVGNFSYASSFGAVVLEVRIDPADVVSVPADCSFQKLRCCRYEVIAIHDSGEDDIADAYEPESVFDSEKVDETLDGFMDSVPETFISALRSRIKGRFGRKNKDA